MVITQHCQGKTDKSKNIMDMIYKDQFNSMYVCFPLTNGNIFLSASYLLVLKIINITYKNYNTKEYNSIFVNKLK